MQSYRRLVSLEAHHNMLPWLLADSCRWCCHEDCYPTCSKHAAALQPPHVTYSARFTTPAAGHDGSHSTRIQPLRAKHTARPKHRLITPAGLMLAAVLQVLQSLLAVPALACGHVQPGSPPCHVIPPGLQ